MLKSFLVPISLCLILTQSSAQIPYSYASGRNVTAVNLRYAAFKAAQAAGSGSDILQQICGPLRLSGAQSYCTTKVGRPKDSETASCDVYCCLAGHKTGNCQTKVGIQVQASTVAGVVGGGTTSATDVLTMIPSLVQLSASCRCLDDDLDVKCGLDGSFMGIRCPDNSACWRKCCRRGQSGGRCGGFLKLKCKCS